MKTPQQLSFAEVILTMPFVEVTTTFSPRKRKTPVFRIFLPVLSVKIKR